MLGINDYNSDIQGGYSHGFTFGFLLINEFTMLSLATAVEPLRMANQLAGEELYKWVLISQDGEPVTASDGIEINVNHSLADEIRLDALLVAGGLNVTKNCTPQQMAWLRKLDRKGMLLGGICTGAHVLAEAHLMDGEECSAHWEALAAIRETHPQVKCTEKLYSLRPKRITCTGGLVPMDMMLKIITESHGHQLTSAISEMFICDRIRDENDQQKSPLKHILGTSQPKLIEAAELMQANIEEPLSLTELAEYLTISRRQLERLFKNNGLISPSRYYLKLRLHRARELLTQTSMSIIDIAAACGFVSPPHFSKCYRAYMGVPPKQERLGLNKQNQHKM